MIVECVDMMRQAGAHTLIAGLRQVAQIGIWPPKAPPAPWPASQPPWWTFPSWPNSAWWTTALVFGAVALLILWRALLADRARGRRRCPKCWYDMSGTPGLVCSECGYRARRERRLFKTRRRPVVATLGLIALLMSASSALMPKLRRDGWESLVPTPILIMGMPELQTRSPRLYAFLEDRVERGEVAAWELRRLVRRAMTGPSAVTVKAATREVWPTDVDDRRYLLTAARCDSGWRWLNSQRVRVSITAGDDPGQPHHFTVKDSDVVCLCNGRTSYSWLDPTCPMPESERFKPALKLQIETSLAARCGAEWVRVPIQTDRIELPFSDSGTLQDRMTATACPVLEDWLRRSLNVLANERGVWLRVGRSAEPIEECSKVTIAFDVELLRDGEVFASTTAWCPASRLIGFRERNDKQVSLGQPGTSGVGTFGGEWPALLVPPVENLARSKWAIRLRPSARIALRDFESNEFLDATLEFRVRPEFDPAFPNSIRWVH